MVEPDQHGARRATSLAELAALKDAIDSEIDREIIVARRQGATWAELGPTKQAAHQRHAVAVQRVGTI